jgi:lon-related putative ATP-dependent protease
MKTRKLEHNEIGITVDPASLGFEKLSDLNPSGMTEPGQARAVKALRQGLGMQAYGFNIFAAGPRETGMLDMVEQLTRREAEGREPSDISDWCYCHNFRNPDRPLAIRLASGSGEILKKEMAELLVSLKLHIPKNFEGDTYLSKKEEVIREFNGKRNALFDELDKTVRRSGFVLKSEPAGMMVLPAADDGTPMGSEVISRLSEEEQEKLKKTSAEMHKVMGSAMRRLHDLEKDVRERLKELDREVARETATEIVAPLKRKYADHPVIPAWLDDVVEDVVMNLKDFRAGAESPPEMPFPFPGAGPDFSRYDINILVDNGEGSGVPVVVETNPSYPNLFGTLERKAQFGTLFTDFTMIKAGSLHRANGGYLIIKAMDLLKWPFSYEALKRTLRRGEIEIEDAGEQLGLITTKAIKPEPVALDVKIILVGHPVIHQILYNVDEDFRELFKIKAHFDTMMDLTPEKRDEFVRKLAEFTRDEGITDIHCTGVARLLEYSARLAGSVDKLSLKLDDITDIIKEAAYWAGAEKSLLVHDTHVQQAIDARIERNSLYRDRLEEMLERDIIKVRTDGEATGQINGLAVYNPGDIMFGKPSRITASFSLGKEGVVNIERKADLSGQIHTKGMMILAGYISSMFARKRPLTLSATICFEQSYGMIDGDSASGAELFALLSAISGVPIKQGIACTGAISQKGEILPIGGVTEKVEGFFDLCDARGLDGSQGVIIPETNIRDLMPEKRVREAIRRNRFHIWPISTVEEGISILMGKPAGRRTKRGSFTKGSIFAMVDAKLAELAETARNFANSGKK